MRITVLSDSHRRGNRVRRILEERQDSDHIFFLGDVVTDIEDLQAKFPAKTFYIVSGNCDPFSLLPSSGIEQLAGRRIFYTHGHVFGVKHGIGQLLHAAKAANCEIALYGHTHIPQIVYEDGLYLVNPGSCGAPRDGKATYAVIDLEPSGIMPILVEIT